MGVSACFHAASVGAILFALNGSLTPKHEFSNAILVNLVQAGEPLKNSPEADPSPKVDVKKPESMEVPEPPVPPFSPSVGQELDRLPPENAPQQSFEIVIPENLKLMKTRTERLLLARIPRSTLASLLGKYNSSPEAGGDIRDKNSAASSKELERFIAEIRGRLEAAKRYPFLARLRGQEGVVHISFWINGAGKAVDVHLVQSSEWPILNREAFKTVRRVNQFSYPPQQWKEGIQIKVPLAFRLEGKQ